MLKLNSVQNAYSVDIKLWSLNNISYIGFRQVIRAHITCLCFIFPEPKAREIYNSDRLYEPVLPV